MFLDVGRGTVTCCITWMRACSARWWWHESVIHNKKDVAIIGINSNKAESADEIKDHAQEHMLAFTILKDVNNVVADQLDANHTPEIYVVHPKTMEVLYHGRIDDSQREAKITSRDLRTALDEVLSGKQVTSKETKALGCSIKRVK